MGLSRPLQRPHGNSADICPSGHFSGWLFSSIPLYGFIFFSSAFSSVRKLSFPPLKRAVAHLQASLFPAFVSFPRHLRFEEAAEKEQIISSFMISKGKSRRLHKENWQDLKLFAFHTNQKFSKFFFFFFFLKNCQIKQEKKNWSEHWNTCCRPRGFEFSSFSLGSRNSLN